MKKKLNILIFILLANTIFAQKANRITYKIQSTSESFVKDQLKDWVKGSEFFEDMGIRFELDPLYYLVFNKKNIRSKLELNTTIEDSNGFIDFMMSMADSETKKELEETLKQMESGIEMDFVYAKNESLFLSNNGLSDEKGYGYMEGDPSNWRSPNLNYEIKKVKGEKKILGFSCRRVDIYVDKIKKETVWYTKELPKTQNIGLLSAPESQLPGFPLEIEFIDNEEIVLFKAVDFNSEFIVDANYFNAEYIPEDFKDLYYIDVSEAIINPRDLYRIKLFKE